MATTKDPLSAQAWWGRVEACQKVKKNDLLRTWQDSVSYCRMKPFRTTPPEDTVNIPADWARTKNKKSQLFYQVPELVLKARRPEWRAATAVFASALNFELSERVHAEHMMNECLSDLINAAGIMVCKVGYEGSFEDKPLQPPLQNQLPGQVPQLPTPQMSAVSGAQVAPDQQPLPDQTQTVPIPVYECYYARRISPLHFIWPLEFHGSNWQEAAYLGWEGYMPVAEAQRLGWVDETVEGVQIDDADWLLIREYNELKPADRFIKFVELFFRPATYDPNEHDPRKIQRIVLVAGGEKDSEKSKVVDEPFSWQKQDPATGRWVGMTDFPIKVGKITHISDMAIPPSDSEAGRPQVRELIRSRSQMIRQRDHSLPLRWFDTNVVDPEIGDRMRRGKYQDMIPMNGPGDHAIGEVARAAFPNENWEFEKVIRNDLDESWSMGANQQGLRTAGDTTATEVETIQGANNVRLDFERQWVLKFFVEVAQGVGQLMQMFADKEEYTYILGQQGEETLEQWDKTKIQGDFIFKIKPDSQLRVDVQAERTMSLNLYKLLRQDPLINPTELVSRVIELHGLDPSKVVVPPQPPAPEGPNIGYSFKGEDLANALVVALVQKTKTPVTPQDVQAAQQLIDSLGIASPEPPQPQVPLPVTGANPPHPGPPPVQQPINRRYDEHVGTPVEGSRDSGLPQVPKK